MAGRTCSRNLLAEAFRFAAAATWWGRWGEGTAWETAVRHTMRLEISAPCLERLNGECQSFLRERRRKRHTHRVPAGARTSASRAIRSSATCLFFSRSASAYLG